MAAHTFWTGPGRSGLTLLCIVALLAMFQACGGITDDCPTGLKACGDVCSDFHVDPQNCGGCGKKCGSGQVCNDSVCGLPCGFPTDQRCDGVCVQLDDNHEHCGACHHACAASQTCFASQCRAN